MFVSVMFGSWDKMRSCDFSYLPIVGPFLSEDQDCVSFGQADERKIGFDYLNRNCPAADGWFSAAR